MEGGRWKVEGGRWKVEVEVEGHPAHRALVHLVPLQVLVGLVDRVVQLDAVWPNLLDEGRVPRHVVRPERLDQVVLSEKRSCFSRWNHKNRAPR